MGIGASAIGPISSAIGGITGDILGGTQVSGGMTAAQNAQNAAYQQAIQSLQSNFSPYAQMGQSLIGAGQNLATAPAIAPTIGTQPFNYQQYMNTPGYQFALQQGQQGINAALASQGKLGTGQNATELADYNQGLASQYYQQAFNNMLSQNQAAFGQGLASQSQQVQNLLPFLNLGYNASTGLGSGLANLYTGQGQMQGNYALGQAQNRAAMYGGITNQLGQLPGQIFGSQQGANMNNAYMQYLNNLGGMGGGGMSGGNMGLPQIPDFNLSTGAGFGAGGMAIPGM